LKLGDRLRQIREQSKLSQIQVKERTGINNKTLSNYENNISSPDPYTLKVLADLYEVSTDWIISGQQQSLTKSTYNSLYISDEDLQFLIKLNKLSPNKRRAIEILISDNDNSPQCKNDTY
jgi:transcriptional regulator with XRE-family HTH domain